MEMRKKSYFKYLISRLKSLQNVNESWSHKLLVLSPQEIPFLSKTNDDDNKHLIMARTMAKGTMDKWN